MMYILYMCIYIYKYIYIYIHRYDFLLYLDNISGSFRKMGGGSSKLPAMLKIGLDRPRAVEVGAVSPGLSMRLYGTPTSWEIGEK